MGINGNIRGINRNIWELTGHFGVIYTNCIYLVIWQTMGLILEHFLKCLLKYLLRKTNLR